MLDLANVLASIKEATGIQPTAFNTKSVNGVPAINYLAYVARDDGAKEVWRFQTRITARTYVEAIEVDRKMRDTLVTLGDEPKFNSKIEVNGGGTLEDEATSYPQIITYYDITTKGV